MIVTESKNRKIKICDQILEEIYSQIQKNDYDPEKGGIIVGRENLNNENIILEYISKPLKMIYVPEPDIPEKMKDI